MSLRTLLENLRRGQKGRETLAHSCYVKALSRYKIMNNAVIEGLYEDLRNEAFVIELTCKENTADKEIVFLGSHAGPDLLKIANQPTPPCFNPLRTETPNQYPQTHSTKNTPSKPYSQFNKELYDAINLFYCRYDITERDTRREKGREESPTTKCLSKLKWNGGEDLGVSWAKAINTIFTKYKTNINDMVAQLSLNNINVRNFNFPIIRTKLEEALVEDIRF